MNLDKLQFKASVRSGWQAIDLGYLMASAWWRPLFVTGALPSLLFFILLLIIFFDNPLWAGFFIWWLKPFWERLPLYYASRRIFDEQPTITEVLWQTGSLFKKELIPWLLWRRFSVQRAFNAPVTVLEELNRESRKKRLAVLHGKYSDIAFANQAIGFCFELIFCFGIAALILFFIPEDLGFDTFDTTDQLNLVGEWFYTWCWYLAITLLMPFHTMAGFALYLNRRIELEAWDIEITFRNLAQRKRDSSRSAASLALVALLAGLIAITTPSASYAAINHDSGSAKKLIDEVLQGEDFGQDRIVRKWRFKNLVEENEDKIPEWFIDFIEWWENNIDLSGNDDGISITAASLKLLLIASFILLIVYLLYRYRGPLNRLQSRNKTGAAPELMFGLDVTPESLPDDIPTQVMSFWHEGRQREALGLLYRATLSRLIDQHALTFKASHTEAECAALVKARGIETLSSYFSGLTRVWCHLAYGHELPVNEAMQKLCDGWNEEMTDAVH
ncbi:MAG: DUF4129 domain-containing protein [Gammaproteobacteria bacterium]